jgi:hypothetical protein
MADPSTLPLPPATLAPVTHLPLPHLPPPPPLRQRIRARGSLGKAVGGYSSVEPPPPLGSYAVLAGAFTGIFGGLLALGARRRRLPASLPVGDLALLGVATFVATRVVARDEVTSFLRAPFTHLKKKAGAGELVEEARGEGMQLALGQLLTCPYCLAPWVASSLTAGLLIAPKVTRTVLGVAAVVGVSQTLTQAYSALRKQS